MNFPALYQWPAHLKLFIATFVFVLSIGVTIGLIYVELSTGMNPSGTTEHYRGSELGNDFDIPEKFPQSLENLLLTTHSHVISFSLIFFVLGGILYFSSLLGEGWKKFLMIEPLVSTLVTFGSIWGIRYIHSAFSFLIMLSGILMYASFYIITALILYEVLLKKGVSFSNSQPIS